MKKYHIIVLTEYIIDANTRKEALDMIDDCDVVDAYYELIEEISEEE